MTFCELKITKVAVVKDFTSDSPVIKELAGKVSGELMEAADLPVFLRYNIA